MSTGRSPHHPTSTGDDLCAVLSPVSRSSTGCLGQSQSLAVFVVEDKAPNTPLVLLSHRRPSGTVPVGSRPCLHCWFVETVPFKLLIDGRHWLMPGQPGFLALSITTKLPVAMSRRPPDGLGNSTDGQRSSPRACCPRPPGLSRSSLHRVRHRLAPSVSPGSGLAARS